MEKIVPRKEVEEVLRQLNMNQLNAIISLIAHEPTDTALETLLNVFQEKEDIRNRRKAVFIKIYYNYDDFGHNPDLVSLVIFGDNQEEVEALRDLFIRNVMCGNADTLVEDWPKTYLKKLTPEKVTYILDTKEGLVPVEKDFYKEVKPALMANIDEHGAHIIRLQK